MLLLCYSVNAQSDYNIRLKSGEIAAIDKIPIDQLDQVLDDSNNYGNQHYVILQFQQIPDNIAQIQLSNIGVELMNYLPNYAFYAAINEGVDYTQLNGVVSVVDIKPIHKKSTNIASQNYPPHTIQGDMIELAVIPYPNIDEETFLAYLENEGYQVNIRPDLVKGYSISLPISSIDDFAALTPVFYMEAIEDTPVPDGLLGKTSHRSNLVSGSPGTGYDGTDVVMGIADDGGISHIDFHGRLTDHTTSAGGTHGDMVSGIACGSGNLDPTKLGMGTGAYLHIYNISGYPHITNALTNYTNLGTTVTSTSYSEPGTYGGTYSLSAEDLDTDVGIQNELLHVFSAGNSASQNYSPTYAGITDAQGYFFGNITGGRKAAKHSIACANLNYKDERTLSSSRGPCEDGRIKPDISAHGTGQLTTAPNNTYQSGGGTSAASPGVAGVATQLYQAYKENNGGVTPISSLIKGIMLNTADDLGRIGPDYDHGWGRVNANNAVEVILNNQFINSSVSQGVTNNHVITVPANVDQLKVMVYWLDETGSPTAAQALVNDIDMEMETPGGATYLPWKLSTVALLDSLEKVAYRDKDHINNMEQITLDAPAAGNYTFDIEGFSIPTGPQDYHLVYSFVMDEVKMTYPNGGECFQSGDILTLRWDAFGTTGNFDLEYTIDDEATWQTIANITDASQRYFDWTVPGSIGVSKIKFRVTRNSQSDISDSGANVIGTPDVSASAQNLTWPAIAGAEEYDIYKLGSLYMEIVATTSTNSYMLPPSDLDGNVYWYSVRARDTDDNVEGCRSNSIAYQNCFDLTCTITLPYQQDFDDESGWCNESSDDIDWTINTGATGSSNTGPSTGTYAYVEATNNFNLTAILNLPCVDITSNSDAFIIFDYHMFGAAMGTLDLEISTNSGSSWTNIWTLSGNQGDQWLNANIDATAYVGNNILLRFVGLTGSSFTSDMAINNLKIETSPAGYECTDPLFITDNGIYTAPGPSRLAGASQGDATHANWFEFTPAIDSDLKVASCGAFPDTRLWIHEGACGSSTIIASSDNDCLDANNKLFASEVDNIPVLGGTTYYIEWDDRWSIGGFDFEFELTCPGGGKIGCSNSNACNYDPAATCDDGSCVSIELVDIPDEMNDCINTTFDLGTVSVVDVNSTPNTIESFHTALPTSATDDTNIILPANYQISTTSTIYARVAELTLGCYDTKSFVVTIQPFVPGCTNPSASNYDAAANCDDGSCLCETTLDLDGVVSTGIYQASDVLTSDGQINISSGGDVTFQAGNYVELQPGFESKQEVFIAEIATCTPSTLTNPTVEQSAIMDWYDYFKEQLSQWFDK